MLATEDILLVHICCITIPVLRDPVIQCLESETKEHNHTTATCPHPSSHACTTH